MTTLRETLENRIFPLFTYINESAYTKELRSVDELFKYCSDLFKNVDDIDFNQIKNWLESLFPTPSDISFMVASSGEVFKIPRYTYQAIDDTELPSCLTVEIGKSSPSDRAIYYQREGEKRKRIAQTGDGSAGRVSTESQESATCLIWNKFVDSLDNKQEAKFMMDRDHMEEVIGDFAADMDGSWYNSFMYQITSILDFLKSCGIKKAEDIKKYRACRFGGDAYVDNTGEMRTSKTGKAYSKFVDNYMTLLAKTVLGGQKPRKDNYDPSDIVIYKADPPGISAKMVELANLAKDYDSANDVCDAYRKFFATNTLFGVSLKKCAGKGTYDVFNIYPQDKNSVRITEVIDVTGKKARNCQLKVKGQFNFAGVSDPDPKKLGSHLSEHDVYVTLRSFGNANAMDIRATTGPAIGKVPVRDWTEKLNVESSNLDGGIKALKDLAVRINNGDKDATDILAELIQGGIKNGPWCLPFVLIH